MSKTAKQKSEEYTFDARVFIRSLDDAFECTK
jgi:hypothetical protein